MSSVSDLSPAIYFAFSGKAKNPNTLPSGEDSAATAKSEASGLNGYAEVGIPTGSTNCAATCPEEVNSLNISGCILRRMSFPAAAAKYE